METIRTVRTLFSGNAITRRMATQITLLIGKLKVSFGVISSSPRICVCVWDKPEIKVLKKHVLMVHPAFSYGKSKHSF